MSCGTVSPSFACAEVEKHKQRKPIRALSIAASLYQSRISGAITGGLPYVLNGSSSNIARGAARSLGVPQPLSLNPGWSGEIVFRPVSGAGMAVFRRLVVSFVVSQPIV